MIKFYVLFSFYLKVNLKYLSIPTPIQKYSQLTHLESTLTLCITRYGKLTGDSI